MTDSEQNPDGIPMESNPPRVRAQTRGPSPSPYPTTTPSLPTSTEDGEGREGLITDLVARGVRSANARSLVADHPADRIAAALDWFDQQQAGSVGAGVLVAAVREGRTVAQRPKSLLDRQVEYGDQIVAWLTENFPDLVDPREGPHPAAITAVIHLHYKHGKGRLTKREHGPEIRAAVKAFNAKWLEPEESAA